MVAGFWGALGGGVGGAFVNLSVNASPRAAAVYAIATIFITGGIGSVQGLGDPPSPPCK